MVDPETRIDAKRYIDIRLARHAVQKKDEKRISELIRISEFDHIHKAWLMTQAAQLLTKTDREKALSLTELAIGEARRISPSDPDSPRAFLCAVNAVFLLDRSAVWETMNEAIKNANSAENFTGEDTQLQFRLVLKSGLTYVSSESVPDFTLQNIFKGLAEFDYEKAVQLAGGLKRDAPRSAATLAIAGAVLETKEK